MEAALIIASALLVAGVILYVHHRMTGGDDSAQSVVDATEPGNGEGGGTEECCGMHVTCEKDSLLTALADGIVYYDDEELDVYAGRQADSYTDEEIERFRDVLLTLLPDDIAGWSRSVQLRGITLPQAVRDELIMIVSEARMARQNV